MKKEAWTQKKLAWLKTNQYEVFSCVMYPSDLDRQREYTEIKLTPERVINKKRKKKKKKNLKRNTRNISVCLIKIRSTPKQRKIFSTKIKNILFKLSDICLF